VHPLLVGGDVAESSGGSDLVLGGGALLEKLSSGPITPSSTIIFLLQWLSRTRDPSSLAASALARSLGWPIWMVAMEDQTQARMGSLLAMGGRERLVPLSVSKIESSHFMSPMEDSRRPTTPYGVWPGVVGHPSIFFSFFFFFFGFWIFFFFFLSDGGILGINRLNWLNCHNLKVWRGKVSYFKLLRQKWKWVDTS
jgi:hypothetical protein